MSEVKRFKAILHEDEILAHPSPEAYKWSGEVVLASDFDAERQRRVALEAERDRLREEVRDYARFYELVDGLGIDDAIDVEYQSICDRIEARRQQHGKAT